MTPEPDNQLRLEIGHVLFIDIVGYSKLLIEEQKERLDQLTKIVLGTLQVRDSIDEQLVRLPTGDGMALVFRHSAEEPARAAAALRQLHTLLPNFGATAREEYGKWNDPEFVEHLLDGLRKAGLAVD